MFTYVGLVDSLDSAGERKTKINLVYHFRKVEYMKAQDLRIGNIIWRPCCNDVIVEIRENGIIGSDRLRGLISFNELKPITLTKELLLKNGFKINGSCFEYTDNEDELCIEFLGKYIRIGYARMFHCPEDVTECEYSSEIDLPSPLFVHTLQNIWYLLTGKELETKL